jgi:hypothetical protein
VVNLDKRRMTLRAVFQIGLHNAHKMAGFNPELSVEIYGNHITVTLPGTTYSVTYFKPRGQRWLAAKDIVHTNDLRIAMTSAEFLAKAWKVANDKARELGWIV